MDNELIKKLNAEVPPEVQVSSDELQKLKDEDSLPAINTSNQNGLNDDQNQGLSTILDWMKTYKGSRNENAYFSLRGSAGTGKTTLISILLKEIKKGTTGFMPSRVCICAPTHKAKKVILAKTKWDNGETLQALLGLKLDTNLEDFDPNKPEFAQTGVRKIQDYSLVVIDEASMVNKALYELILTSGKGILVLFVGDHVQLSPVKEDNISLALTNPVHSYTITTPARQKVGNPLLALLNILRKDIEEGTQTYKDVLKGGNQINSEGEGYTVTNISEQFGKRMVEVFSSEEFKQDKDHCRAIAWTNDNVTKMNRWIRKFAFKSESTVDIGDSILCYRTIASEDEVIMVNSDDYIVEKVISIDIDDFELPLKGLKVKLRSIDTGITTDIVLLEKGNDNAQNYVKIYEEWLMEAQVKRTWVKRFYPLFRNYLLVTEDLKFFSQLNQEIKVKKDLDYGYSITAHKSQGSTYNTVFVNYKDIAQVVTFARANEKEAAERMKKRLLYVALSRASRIAHLIM